MASCGIDQTVLLSVQSILCRWIGICTADEVDTSSEINSVIMQISYQSCVRRTIVCNKENLSQTVFTLAFHETVSRCLSSEKHLQKSVTWFNLIGHEHGMTQVKSCHHFHATFNFRPSFSRAKTRA